MRGGGRAQHRGERGMSGSSFLTHWYLHGANLVLMTLICLLAVRLVLSLAIGANNLVMRGLAAITAPVAVVVGAITPRIVPFPVVLLFAIGWLVAFRISLSMMALAMGVRL
jgi:hypothetical protein